MDYEKLYERLYLTKNEWLEMLPDCEVKFNIEMQAANLKRTYVQFNDLIINGITWSRTPQGTSYWKSLYKSIHEKTFHILYLNVDKKVYIKNLIEQL